MRYWKHNDNLTKPLVYRDENEPLSSCSEDGPCWIEINQEEYALLLGFLGWTEWDETP